MGTACDATPTPPTMMMCAYFLGSDSSASGERMSAYASSPSVARVLPHRARKKSENCRDAAAHTALGAWRVALGAGAGRGGRGVGAGRGGRRAGRRRACVPKKEPMMNGLMGLPTMGLLRLTNQLGTKGVRRRKKLKSSQFS